MQNARCMAVWVQYYPDTICDNWDLVDKHFQHALIHIIASDK